MNKIKILFCLTKLELGGAQKQVLSLIGSLDKNSFSPYLFTACHGMLIDEAKCIPGLEIKFSRFLERPINVFKDFFSLIEAYRFIRKEKIHIVHTHSSKAGIIGRLAAHFAGVKIIIHTVHGWSFNDFQPPFVRRFYILLEKVCGRFSSKLVVVSEHDHAKGISKNIADPAKFRLIYYGIDKDGFSDNPVRIKDDYNKDDFVVGMISCFKPQKAPVDFVKFAYLLRKKLPCVKFVLAGDGVLRKEIEEAVKKHSLCGQFILAGWCRQIPEFLSGLDLFVLTSLWEGMPISVLEAMSSGLPVLATQTGGISEVVKEAETGFLVKPHDMHIMAEKAFTLLKNGNLRQQIGRNAKNFLAGRFTLHETVSMHQQLYRELLNN